MRQRLCGALGQGEVTVVMEHVSSFFGVVGFPAVFPENLQWIATK